VTNFIIDLDPTTIMITRHTKVLVGGFTTLTTTTLAPIVVRLYNYSTRNQREFVNDTGEVKRIDIGILAEPDEDIRVCHESFDTFDIADTSSPPDIRTYRIVGVRHYAGPYMPNPCIECDAVAV
jgi:hypothetical protein